MITGITTTTTTTTTTTHFCFVCFLFWGWASRISLRDLGRFLGIVGVGVVWKVLNGLLVLLLLLQVVFYLCSILSKKAYLLFNILSPLDFPAVTLLSLLQTSGRSNVNVAAVCQLIQVASFLPSFRSAIGWDPSIHPSIHPLISIYNRYYLSLNSPVEIHLSIHYSISIHPSIEIHSFIYHPSLVPLKSIHLSECRSVELHLPTCFSTTTITTTTSTTIIIYY